jgi:hypothetical protein
MEFDGPHFDASLIGPDGKLSRLHKGGAQKQANKLAKQSMLQQAEDAKLMREQAAKTADEYKVAAERDNEMLRQEYAGMASKLESLNQAPPPTTVIRDDRRRRRSAFGMSSARAMNPYALGGSPTMLG